MSGTGTELPSLNLLPIDIDGFDSLAALALDLHWTWNHATDEIWRQLDPALWNVTRNPWAVLQTVSRDRLKLLLADPSFGGKVDGLLQFRREALSAPAWFQQEHQESPLSCVAYFSMEFMLNEALPIYSGGLGNVAGDQLKSASDLGVPVVGVGLLYQQGYFRQVIDADGAQEAIYPFNDPGQLPISPLRMPNGEWLRLQVPLSGDSVWLRAWQVQVGKVRLFLLDSNDPANAPEDRTITSELYGGGPELRLKQEVLLGIGGWRLLEALGMHPEVCHLNEGHAAFAVLERARCFMESAGGAFDIAMRVTRAGNLFTTHTAVAAGFDRFAPALMQKYLAGYVEGELGIPFRDILTLGRMNADDASEPFNMAYLAIRGSGAVNGVSQLHGLVSRQLFAPLFPRWPKNEVPVSTVTNGVHVPGWDSAGADALWTKACGKDRWLEPAVTLSEKFRSVTDDDLWRFRGEKSAALVEFARSRVSLKSAAPGASDDADRLFDPDALTLGFARRFAPYKRPNLLLHDRARLLRLLADKERPVQLIMAGKAHPEDRAGQALIQEWVRFIDQPEVRPHIIFLSDYDMQMTENLVQGVDVWLNTPRRPWEACGTSGMKVLVNGGINLSELDGWWAEAYTSDVGWAIGDGKEHGDDPALDAAEATTLYELLELAVIPEFYDRDANGIPVAWVRRMRESMATLTPRFSANRAVREYTGTHYVPAADAYRLRSDNKGAVGQKMAEWQRGLNVKWSKIHIDSVKIETRGDQHDFEIRVCLHDLDADAVSVELYADGVDGGCPILKEARRVRRPKAGSSDGGVYVAVVSAARPANDFTVRIVPSCEGVAVPLENARILWQR